MYLSDVKWGAKIIPASSTSDSMAWRASGNHIVIDGFDIDGQSSLGWRNGIYATGSNITVRNNRVHHIGNQSACDSNGGAGIGMDGYFGGSVHEAESNVVHNIGRAGCTYYHGIYTASFDFTIKNNMSYQNTGTGIHSNHDSGRGYIVNNTVFRNGRLGILCEGNDFRNVSVAGPFIIQNNIVYDNYPTGSSGAGNVGGIGIVGTVVSNNVISNNYTLLNRDLEIYVPSGKGTVSNNMSGGVPGFVNYKIDGSGDYRLLSNSQLIDKGVATNAPAVDIQRTARPQGAAVDIGSYEYKAL
ncbi:right-handed parallel beta-helix repeat-containing protein [Noviherbaspirillum saxi]|uniref:right-handed parallel beta-helix repeat-containing protein n=1 Tax=Noviherbaspirillum saxi TaxID=2320863 RepID=UPI003082CEFC